MVTALDQPAVLTCAPCASMSSRLPKRSSHYSSSHAKKQSNQIVRRPLSREAVAQSKGVIEFLCVCYKVTVRDRIISVTEEPLWLSGSLSGGRRKRQLSHSYNGFGLCDSVTK